MQPTTITERLSSALRARVPTPPWGLVRGLIEMSVLASFVPVASDLVVSSVFVYYSAFSAWRLLRRRSVSAGSSYAESSDCNGEELLRLQDRFDATTGFWDDIGRIMPLSIPVLWFSLSIPSYVEAGRFSGAGLLAMAAVSMFLPLFLSSRDGLLNAVERWRSNGPLRPCSRSAAPSEALRRFGWFQPRILSSNRDAGCR